MRGLPASGSGRLISITTRLEEAGLRTLPEIREDFYLILELQNSIISSEGTVSEGMMVSE
jgi:hypothetical protein